MRKKSTYIILIVMMICTATAFSTVTAFGASASVRVTLPNFSVTMNGQVVNNDYSQYPLIVYKDITYFPMTYSDCRFLGIESSWKGSKEGLLIEKTDISVAYSPYKAKAKNGGSYTATVPSFPIAVNGKSVDNAKEQYPLLSFRDVTYFPMTWKWSVEAFGWDYTFDGKKGLIIKSGNIPVAQSSPLSSRGKDLDGKFKNHMVAIAKGKVYYEAAQGKIMVAPISDAGKGTQLYQLELDDYGSAETYVYGDIHNESGKVFLRFHRGGATMGSDWLVQLDSSPPKVWQSSYMRAVFADQQLFYYWMGPAPGPGSLLKGDMEDPLGRIESYWKEGAGRIGSIDYWYVGMSGWNPGIPEFTLVGEDLYLLAAQGVVSAEGYVSHLEYKVSKVNLKTNEVTQLGTKKADIAQIEGEYLYYLSDDDFYRMPLKGGAEERLGSFESFDRMVMVLNGKVYWKYANDEQLYQLGEKQSLNPGAKLESMRFAGDNNEYLVCTFEETAAARYRFMIFDKGGKVVFKSSDKTLATNVTIEGKNVYYFNHNLGTICSIGL